MPGGQPHQSSAKFEGPMFIEEPSDCGGLTLSRHIARFLSRYKWYYPERDNPNVCLDEAWSHFERVTLPRHFCDLLSMKSGEGFEKAGIGENGRATKLYPVWDTPLQELADFGLGVGMYFATLKILVIILLIGGVINSAAFMYYRSEEYTAILSDEEDNRSLILQATAVCPNTEYVPCPDCLKEDWDKDEDRYVDIFSGFILVQKNVCDNLSLTHGFTSLASILFVIVAMVVLGKYNKLVEKRFDENEQTSQDYSLVVKNPPVNEFDPDVYKQYFEELTGEHVTVVTIALDNTRLLRALMNRRRCIQTLHDIAVCTSSLELFLRESLKILDQESMFSILDFSVNITEDDIEREANGPQWTRKRKLMRKVMKYDEIIRNLYTEEYNACRVFITFETEVGQRTAIDLLTIARRESRSLRSNHYDDSDEDANDLVSSLFMDNRIPKVTEAMEPSAIRWIDFGVPTKIRAIQRITTLTITLIMIGVVVYVVGVLQELGPLYASLFISISNTVAPLLCTIINREESHNAEGSSQSFLYAKITLVRWANTAIVLSYITPFTKTISDNESSLIPSVLALFFTETFTAPIIKYLDIVSNIKKHLLAPREKTQQSMNVNFNGTPYYLAERYTDMTKVLFVTCFYSAIFPPAYFFGALSLFMYYWIDKFLVMRTWAPAPALGSQISKLSRGYFVLSCLALSVMTAYWWSGFPFDNLCSCENNPDYEGCKEQYPETLVNDWNVSEKYRNKVLNLNSTYYYCNQDLLRSSEFPPSTVHGNEWMEDDQMLIVDVFGYISLVIIVTLSYILFGEKILEYFKKTQSTTYEPNETKDQCIDFSCINEIYGFVPQMVGKGFQFPLLACDIDDINSDLIYWSDHKRGFDYWNVIYDVPGWPGQKRNRDHESVFSGEDTSESREGTPVFSIVAHYPPNYNTDSEIEDKDIQ